MRFKQVSTIWYPQWSTLNYVTSINSFLVTHYQISRVMLLSFEESPLKTENLIERMDRRTPLLLQCEGHSFIGHTAYFCGKDLAISMAADVAFNKRLLKMEMYLQNNWEVISICPLELFFLSCTGMVFFTLYNVLIQQGINPNMTSA